MRGSLAILAAAAALAACNPIPVERVAGDPGAPIARPGGPDLAPGLDPDTVAYYRQVQRNLIARGQLRTDGGWRDAPFTARDLVENFLQIALYTEFARDRDRLVARTTENRLQRWERPVEIGLIVGAAVPPEQAARDRANIADFAARLKKATGHPVRAVPGGPGNFTVLILSEAERRGFAGELAGLMPGLDAATAAKILDLPPTDYCLVAASSGDSSSTFNRAVAVIRAEHPELMRLSCIHEELAQGMGLINDSPRARPSVFNDDEEFAFLTPMDEILLSMLYDRRLKPGMTEAEARPIVEEIAAEKMGGAS